MSSSGGRKWSRERHGMVLRTAIVSAGPRAAIPAPCGRAAPARREDTTAAPNDRDIRQPRRRRPHRAAPIGPVRPGSARAASRAGAGWIGAWTERMAEAGAVRVRGSAIHRASPRREHSPGYPTVRVIEECPRSGLHLSRFPECGSPHSLIHSFAGIPERGWSHSQHWRAGNSKLLTGDALVVAVMQAHGVTLLTSNDADFDRVPGLTRYAPI